MIAIGVVDVGSPKRGKLGWAILPPNAEPITGGDLDVFIARMGALGGCGPIAVGFEAPMFIPARDVAVEVLTARKGEAPKGERSRPWSGGAGSTVTTTALAVVTYTLRGLRRLLPQATAATDWLGATSAERVLFFEAFVTSAAKGEGHAHDALIAAEAASALLRGSDAYRSAIDEAEVFSLLGASLLRTGWSKDLALLSTPCLVVKPGFDHLASPIH